MEVAKLYTRGEAAEKLRMSVRMLDDRRALGKISFVRIGPKVLFRDQDLNQFIEENIVSSNR